MAGNAFVAAKVIGNFYHWITSTMMAHNIGARLEIQEFISGQKITITRNRYKYCVSTAIWQKVFMGYVRMSKIRYVSLFSGAAGGDLGMQHLLNWECLGYVEWEKYCCKVIEQRIREGFLSDAPIFFGDIREWIKLGYAARYRGLVDVITAGFPCQPFSKAGKRLGKDDPRNMWPATKDAIQIITPDAVLLENVPGIIKSGYIVTVIDDLRDIGYQVLPPLRS